MIEWAATVLVGGLVYPECPRWHGGALWFADQHAGTVCTVDRAGARREVLKVPGRPAGLGWRPDGSLLVVSMDDHLLLVHHDGELLPVADLAPFHPGPSNDMVVTTTGDAYIGNIGFDYYGGEAPRTTGLALVRAGRGEAVPAADDLLVPNGMVVTDDGGQLIVAESFAHRLTQFDVGVDGSLSNRRLFADLGDHIPDGICLDAEGGIWFASVQDHAVLRVLEGGTITHRVTTGEAQAYACMLGGSDRRTLFLCTAFADDPAAAIESRSGAIAHFDGPVPAAGAGLP